MLWWKTFCRLEPGWSPESTLPSIIADATVKWLQWEVGRHGSQASGSYVDLLRSARGGEVRKLQGPRLTHQNAHPHSHGAVCQKQTYHCHPIAFFGVSARKVMRGRVRHNDHCHLGIHWFLRPTISLMERQATQNYCAVYQPNPSTGQRAAVQKYMYQKCTS